MVVRGHESVDSLGRRRLGLHRWRAFVVSLVALSVASFFAGGEALANPLNEAANKAEKAVSPAGGGDGGNPAPTRAVERVGEATRPAGGESTREAPQSAHKAPNPVIDAPESPAEPARETGAPAVVESLGKTTEPVVEPGTETVEPARGAAEETVAPVVDAAKPVGKTVDDAARPVGKTVGDTVEPVGKTVGDAVTSVGKTIEPVSGSVQGTVAPLVEGVAPVVGSVRETVGAGAPTTATSDGLGSGALGPVGAAPALGPTLTPSTNVPGHGASYATPEPFFSEAYAPKPWPPEVAGIAIESRFREGVGLGNHAAPSAQEGPTNTLAASSGSTVTSPALGAQENAEEEGLAGRSLPAFAGSRSPPVYAPSAHGHPTIGSLGAGSSPSRIPLPSPAAPVTGLSGSGGFGGGIGLGVLALLFALSPPGSRLLRSFCEFLRPDSALHLVTERPG